MALKIDAKFKEELTFHFKRDTRDLTNFYSSTRKYNKLPFNLLFNCPRKLSNQVVFFNVQYIYLQGMMAALRINLRIFCNHFMNNIQVKLDQCDIIFLKTFSLEGSK